ncbi:unnamed protein product [Oncorhynchus mykiss]|uniref:Uncharacterized protein n=2 Tax=Oncorhynchus TaxID=8016 RepID=A0A060WLS4_ONCMY|nr:unnamed protein product [Oncorhynchus mykiss]
MLELGSCSVSAQTLADHNALGVPQLARVGVSGSSTPHRYILHPESENWHKDRLGLATGSHSCSLMEPQSLSDSLLSHTAIIDTLYLPHNAHAPRGLSLDVDSSYNGVEGVLGMDPDRPVSPIVIKRRRGGLIEQRDIVKAHQAHKIQSTPQALRKEWE